MQFWHIIYYYGGSYWKSDWTKHRCWNLNHKLLLIIVVGFTLIKARDPIKIKAGPLSTKCTCFVALKWIKCKPLKCFSGFPTVRWKMERRVGLYKQTQESFEPNMVSNKDSAVVLNLHRTADLWPCDASLVENSVIWFVMLSVIVGVPN